MNSNSLNTQPESLDSFGGWGDAEETDFFSEEIVEEDSPKEVEEDGTPTKPDNIENPKEEEAEDFFTAEETSEEEEKTEEDEDDKPVVTDKIATLNYLKSKGLVDFELEEGEELTDELAEELIEDKFEETIEDRIKDKLQSLPEDAQQMIQYAIKGGSVQEFLKEVSKYSNTKITDDIDLGEEKNQELVVREILLEDGEDEETVEAQIEFLKDSGKLKSYSQKKFDRWNTKNKAKKASLLKEQEAQVKAEKEQIKLAKQEALDFFEENTEIGSLKFSKEDKKIIPSYMNDKTIKLQNGSAISEMQKELFYDLPKNKEAFMQLAVLLKNRNTDGTFNFERIEKQTKTKLAKEVKANVRRSKTSIPSAVKTKKSSMKALADYFNN